MGALDPAQLITATASLGAVATGYVLSRRSSDEQRKQQAVANHVAEQTLELDESRDAVRYWQELARERVADLERERAESERQRRLRVESDRQRDEERRRFIDEIATLRSLVLDDVAKAAGVDRIVDVFADPDPDPTPDKDKQ